MKSRLLPRLSAPAILLALALASTVRGQYVEDSVNVGGAWVGSMAYNPLMDVVYGRCYSANRFFAIDCATNQVVSTSTIDAPMYMNYDSIDHKLYLPFGSDEESLAVFDGRTHQRIKTIPLARANQCVWDGMRDRLYVSCPERNVVAVFDCTQDSLICEIPVGNYPLKMYLNGRHRKLYVLNYDEGSVSVINTVNNQTITVIPTGGYAISGHYSTTADKFYCGAAQKVVVIDGALDCVVAEIPAPERGATHALMENPDAGIVLAATVGDTCSHIWSIATGPDTILNDLWSPSNPECILWSPHSRQFYVACYRPVVAVVNSDGSELTVEVPVQSSPFSLALSPQQHRLFVGHLNSPFVYVIRDEVGGIAEGGGTRLPRGAATVVRGSLVLTSAFCNLTSDFVLLDVSGRRVLDLSPGPNYVSHLSPGVYFVATTEGVTGRVVKVR